MIDRGIKNSGLTMGRIQANLLLLFAGAIWGMGFVAQSTAMAAIGPLLFVGLRFTVAIIAVLPFALVESKRAPAPLSRKDWQAFVLIGVLLFCAISLQQIGLLTTTVTNSGFLTGLYVVTTPICGVLLFRESPHGAVWSAALIAVAGIWLLAGGELSSFTTGDWLTIMSAFVCGVVMALIARHARHTARPVTLAVVEFATCSALGLSLAMLFEPIHLSAIWEALPEILYAGIVAGGVAFTLQAIGQRYTTAPQAAIALSSEAVFAAAFAAWILGERLPSIGWIGCVLILIAILITGIAPAMSRKTTSVTP